MAHHGSAAQLISEFSLLLKPTRYLFPKHVPVSIHRCGGGRHPRYQMIMPPMTWHEEEIRLQGHLSVVGWFELRWFDPFICPAKISILGVSPDATFPPWWSPKRGFFFRLKHTTGFQEALIFFRTTWSDEWILKIVCKGWMVLDQLWIFTCIWDEISRHVSLFAKHCLLDICGNQCRVRHSPSTFREVQQHFERVDQLHSIINTCINSSNKHSYMYRVLSGSSHLVSGNHRVKNHGDRKSPNWGCGTPFKWLFHGGLGRSSKYPSPETNNAWRLKPTENPSPFSGAVSYSLPETAFFATNLTEDTSFTHRSAEIGWKHFLGLVAWETPTWKKYCNILKLKIT